MGPALPRLVLTLVALAVSMSALPGCGGGGGAVSSDDGGDPPDAQPTPTATPVPTPTATPVPTPTATPVPTPTATPVPTPTATPVPTPTATPVPTPTGSGPHAGLAWDGSAPLCLSCHRDQATAAHAGAHYQWKGPATYLNNGPTQQGKNAGAVNSYCINITGNWASCGKCHVGRGPLPTATADDAQLANVDCLLCHQKDYKRVKSGTAWVPDTATMQVSLDQAVQTVHSPTRQNCLQCHAFAGGGDSVKRGDITAAHGATSDREFDVHMATTGANLSCQTCHTTLNHRIAGRGSDLHQTDLDVEVSCATCHVAKLQPGGHATNKVDDHVGRVACQTCHLRTFARNATDTAATEATEVHRTWLGTQAAAAPYHPSMALANDLVPRYAFWNRRSTAANAGEVVTMDPATGAYPTSRPSGSVADAASKLYPFKYKTAEQPMVTATRQLVLLDTSVFFAGADPVAATRQGLRNMGLPDTTPYSWVQTDTLQLLNHEIPPASRVLQCAECHANTTRMDLPGKLGYGLKAAQSTLCASCHGREASPGYARVHAKHVDDEGYDCSRCHAFSRPERGLR